MHPRLLAWTVSAFILLCAPTAFADAAADARLTDAIEKLDLQAVKAALAQGAGPNSVSEGNTSKFLRTPLGRVTFIMLLLGSEDTDAAGKAVLIAETLFANGARLGRFDSGILYFPITTGNERLVALLLDKGASPTRRLEGFTPTEVAMQTGQKRVYDLLVSRGGIPIDASKTAQLILVEAAGDGDVKGMEAAVAAGARLNAPVSDGTTALINALRMGVYTRTTAEVIRWLLDKGADPNGKGKSGFQGLEGIPLHIFVAMNSSTMKGVAGRPGTKARAEETLARLLTAGAKVSGMDTKRRTPLHVAAISDNVRAAEVLIREGARVMARDKEGRTPLDYAESAAMIKLLKANGATER